ncbi:MlaE family ABC transporter permease [Nocardioides zeae]|uniref:ABC transporter permease n=1 Tax=Nocardioides zeae TaxID=1457234 RepID=A0A6P0HGA8_9ACTN|nr:ABC transporter permease [Nocardioides zeae]NEN77601.1 ABC transporter permease [Nocardioides zeae]
MAAIVVAPARELGRMLAMALDALVILGTRRFSWREAVLQAWFIARVSLVPTLLVMLGFTLLVMFQVNLLLADLGALDLSGGIAGIAAVQQIGPFVTVVVVAGAGGTAITADLGARTIREEIAAMQVLGIDPVQRLVVPRIVACVAVSLVLNVLISSGGLVGGYFFSVYLQGVTPGAYLDSIPLFTGVPELAFSIVKAFVFGLIAAVIACYRGLNVAGGSKGVGDAVNQAVVITVAVLVPVSLTISLVQFAVL